jgi:hypothetical protein
MNKNNRCAYLLALLPGLAPVLGACSSKDSPANTPVNPDNGRTDQRPARAVAMCAKNDLQIFFSPMYTAFDGTHQFQIPAVVGNVDPTTITWTVSDPALADLQNDVALGGAMISSRKAGNLTVMASGGGVCGTSELTITESSLDDWNIGNMRYNNGIKLVGDVPGRGRPAADAGPPMTDVACTNCHGPTAMGPYKTVSHSPEQTGGFSDEELVNIFTKGTVPIGGYFDSSFVSYDRWRVFHRWDMSPAEAKGVVVYLRSLTPISQAGMRGDFGGRDGGGGRGNGGGGNGNRADATAPATQDAGAADAATD